MPAILHRQHRISRIALLALCPLICLITGCSTLGLQTPTASVTAMSLQDIDAQGLTMNFEVDLKNPNAVALPLANADYALDLGGVKVLSGKAVPQGSLPANGSTAITLPVRLTYDNLFAAEQAIAKGGGDVPYALDGGLSFSTGNALFGTVRAPLRYSGTLQLRPVLSDPKLWLQSDAARKLAQKVLGGILPP